MAIAHDTSTRFPSTDTTGFNTTSGGTLSGNITAGTNARAAVAVVFNAATADPVSTITYDGNAMTLVGSSTDSTETGGIFIYEYLGDVSGTRAFSLTRTATTTQVWAVVTTMTVASGYHVERETTNGVNTTTSSNPTVTLTTGTTTFIVGGVHGGAAAPTSYAVGADETLQFSADYGAKSARASRSTTTHASGSPVYNFTYATSDDWCIRAAAYKEVVNTFAVSQAAWRFYAEGTESGSTALAAQDTDPAIDVTDSQNHIVQLRVRLQETGGANGGSDVYSLQQNTISSGYISIPTGTTYEVNAYDSSSLTDDAATTERLTGGTGSFVAGKVDENNSMSAVTITANNYTELLWSLLLKGSAIRNGYDIDFRVMKNGLTTDMTYTSTPTITFVKNPTYGQDKFAFYEDGTEAASTIIGSENVDISRTVTSDSNLFLRFLISNDNMQTNATTDDWKLQYSQNAGAWTDVGTGAVVGFNSSNLTEGQTATARLQNGVQNYSSGKVSEDGIVEDVQILEDRYTNLLYAITIVSASVADADTLDFRVLRNNATTGITYTETPRITVSNGPTLKSGSDTTEISSTDSGTLGPDSNDEDFEGGSNGADVTTSNTNFSIVSGTGTYTFNSANALHGSLAGAIDGTAGSMRGKLDLAGKRGIVYFSGYYKFTNMVAAKITEFETLPVTDNGVAQIRLQADGQLEITDALGAAGSGTTTTMSLSTNTWYRLDFAINNVSNLITLRIYSGADLESTGTAYDEQITLAMSLEYAERIMVGWAVTAASTMYVDSLAYSTEDWPAPRGVASTPKSGTDSTQISSSETSSIIETALKSGTDSTEISSSEPASDVQTSGNVDKTGSDSTVISSSESTHTDPGGGPTNWDEEETFENATTGQELGGGSDNTIFDDNTGTSTATIVASGALHGSKMAQVSVASSFGTGGINFTSAQSQVWFRGYFKFSHFGTGTNTSIITMYSDTSRTAVRSSVQIMPGSTASLGSIRLRNGTTAVDTADADVLDVDTWYRMEYMVDNTGTTQTLKVWTGANLESTNDADALVLQGTDKFLTGTYNTGTAAMVGVGLLASPGATVVMGIDTVAWGTTDWIGPYSTGGGTETITTSDSTLITGTDAGTVDSGDVQKSGTDSTEITSSETSVRDKFISASDSTQITSSETSVRDKNISASDTTQITSSETSVRDKNISASDTTQITSTETSVRDKFISATDSTQITSTESRSFATVDRSTTDSTQITSSETSVRDKFISASDTTQITSVDAKSDLTVYLTRADSTEIASSESRSFGTVSRSAADSTEVSSSETSSFESTAISGTDSTLISSSEASSIYSTLSRSDSTEISSSETKTVSASLVRADSIDISSSESRTLNVSASRADATEISSSESRTLSVSLTRTDTTEITSTESRSFATVDRSATDTTQITSTESSSLYKQISASDSTEISSTDAGSLDITYKSGSDSTEISSSETKTINVSLTRADSTEITSSESSTFVKQISATDSTQIASSETSAFGTVQRSATDTIEISSSETKTLAVSLTRTDTTQITSTETSVFGTVSRSASDTTQISSTETTSFGTSAFSASDSTQITSTESATPSVSEIGLDDTVIGSSETSDVQISGSLDISGSDSTEISSSETRTVVVSLTRADSTEITSTETSSFYKQISASDSTEISSTDSGALDIIYKSGSDSTEIGGGTAGGQSFSDDFERADAATLGANWIEDATGFSIVSNEAKSDGTTSVAFYATQTDTDDNWSEVTTGAANANPNAAFCRGDGNTAAPTAYGVAVHSTLPLINKWVAGTRTALTSDWGSVVVGDTLRIEADGATISAYHNGVLAASITDNSITTGKYVGFRAAAITQTYTTWSGGDFVAPDGVFSDDFNRADAATLGPNWVSGHSIVSNQMYADVANVNTWYNERATTADNFTQVTPISIDNGDNRLYCRGNGTPTSVTAYYLMLRSNGPTIFKAITGTVTELSSDPGSFVSGDVMYIEANGSSITSKQNGSVLQNITDTSVTTGRYSGIRSASIGRTYEDFSGGNIGGIPAGGGAIETSEIIVSLTQNDSTEISSTESTSFVRYISATDSTQITSSETSSFATVDRSTTDSTQITSSETSLLSVTITRSDTTEISSTEAASNYATAAGADTTQITSTETPVIYVSLSRTDSTELSSTDSGGFNYVPISGSDSTLIGAGGVTFSDDFNRANSPGLGANWTACAGTSNITSNQCQPNAVPTTQKYTGTALSGDDNYAQMTLATVSSPSTVEGTFVRMPDSTTITGYIGRWTSGTTAQIYKVVATAYTALGSSVSDTISSADVVYTEVSGSALTMKRNGIVVRTATDTSITTGTYVGFRSGSSAMRIDDFQAGDLSGGAIETSQVYVFITTDDTTNITSTESVSFGQIDFSSSDTTEIGSAESIDLGGTATKTGIDDTVITSSETASVFADAVTSDTTQITVTETSTLYRDAIGSDSTLISSSETSQIYASSTRDDTTQIGSSETASNYATISASDSTEIGSTESYDLGGSATKTSSDTTEIGSSESVSFATVQFTRTDSTQITSSETAALLVSFTKADSTEISSSEISNIDLSGSIDKSASDTTQITTTESGVNYVSITRSDTTEITSSESRQFATVAVSSADTTQITSVEAFLFATVAIAGTDATQISSSETSAFASTDQTSSDSTLVGSSETASVYAVSVGADSTQITATESGVTTYRQITAPDTTQITATESVAFAPVTLATTDATQIGSTETAYVGLDKSASDSTEIGSTESASVFLSGQVTVNDSDTTEIGSSESTSIGYYILASDSTEIGSTESYAATKQVTASDSTVISSVEAGVFGTNEFEGSDDTDLGSSETSERVIQIFVSDSTEISSIETQSAYQVTVGQLRVESNTQARPHGPMTTTHSNHNIEAEGSTSKGISAW